jgi:hypothetical protein
MEERMEKQLMTVSPDLAEVTSKGVHKGPAPRQQRAARGPKERHYMVLVLAVNI